MTVNNRTRYQVQDLGSFGVWHDVSRHPSMQAAETARRKLPDQGYFARTIDRVTGMRVWDEKHYQVEPSNA